MQLSQPPFPQSWVLGFRTDCGLYAAPCQSHCTSFLLRVVISTFHFYNEHPVLSADSRGRSQTCPLTVTAQ